LRSAQDRKEPVSRRWVTKDAERADVAVRGTVNKKAITVLVALLALCSFTRSTIVQAKPITEAEKRHCEEAYHKYCGEYGLESKALRNCMSRNGRSLPHVYRGAH
jgi:hypothetical protein